MTEDPSRLESKIDEAAAGCSCAGLRRASRAVTQSFDAVLRPSGLRTTQLSLLVALAKLGRVPVSRLAEALVMDRTTLTRNLRPLEKASWIRVVEGPDLRRRAVILTDIVATCNRAADNNSSTPAKSKNRHYHKQRSNRLFKYTHHDYFDPELT